jgi:hypothetical protein
LATGPSGSRAGSASETRERRRTIGWIPALAALALALAIAAGFNAGTALAVLPPQPDMLIDGGGACYDASYDCEVTGGASDTYVEGANMYSYSADAAAGRCRTRWALRYSNNLVGLRQWEYYEQVRWCWNGSIVTQFWRDRWVGTTAWGWGFDGHVSSNCIYEHCYPGRTGHWSEYANTEGHFHVCLGMIGINYCRHRYPWVTITVYGNGSSSASTSD